MCTTARIHASGLIECRSDGSVWRVRNYRGDPVMSRRLDRATKSGYRSVGVTLDRKRVSALAHRLIYMHFHGMIRGKRKQVNHINGDRHDNRPENLEAVTPRMNVRHARDVLGAKHGVRGTDNHMAKLTPTVVAYIKYRLINGERQVDVGRAYGVSQAVVSNIATGKTWRDV